MEVSGGAGSPRRGGLLGLRNGGRGVAPDSPRRARPGRAGPPLPGCAGPGAERGAPRRAGRSGAAPRGEVAEHLGAVRRRPGPRGGAGHVAGSWPPAPWSLCAPRYLLPRLGTARGLGAPGRGRVPVPGRLVCSRRLRLRTRSVPAAPLGRRGGPGAGQGRPRRFRTSLLLPAGWRLLSPSLPVTFGGCGLRLLQAP